jgi:hypothetical protein
MPGKEEPRILVHGTERIAKCPKYGLKGRLPPQGSEFPDDRECEAGRGEPDYEYECDCHAVGCAVPAALVA